MAENIRRMWTSVSRMPERIRTLCASGFDFHFTEPGDLFDSAEGPVIRQLNAEALIGSPECDQNTQELAMLGVNEWPKFKFNNYHDKIDAGRVNDRISLTRPLALHVLGTGLEQAPGQGRQRRTSKRTRRLKSS